MSNSSIIIKIEYRYQESDSWLPISFVPESAKLEQSSKKEAGGWVHTTKVPFKVAKNQASTIEPLASLLRRKAIYKATDGNNVTYTIGTDKLKARLAYTVSVGGTPGSFNGREVEITWQSTTGAAIA